MANHPGLCNDKGLQLFLESDNFALDVSGVSVLGSNVTLRYNLVDQASQRGREHRITIDTQYDNFKLQILRNRRMVRD